MLRLAVDMMQKGPDAAARSRDPWGRDAFGYRRTTNGFELVSQLVRDGKPVSVTVPHPRCRAHGRMALLRTTCDSDAVGLPPYC